MAWSVYLHRPWSDLIFPKPLKFLLLELFLHNHFHRDCPIYRVVGDRLISGKLETGRTGRFNGWVLSTRATIVGIEVSCLAEYKIEKVSYRRIRYVL
jgi:hypothetical protein